MGLENLFKGFLRYWAWVSLGLFGLGLGLGELRALGLGFGFGYLVFRDLGVWIVGHKRYWGRDLDLENWV